VEFVGVVAFEALPLSLRKASGFPDGGSGFEAPPLQRHSRKVIHNCGKPEAFRKDSGKAAKAVSEKERDVYSTFLFSLSFN
jgi:hypothetical protein